MKIRDIIHGNKPSGPIGALTEKSKNATACLYRVCAHSLFFSLESELQPAFLEAPLLRCGVQ